MTNLTNMRIGKRLAVGFGVSAVLMLVMAIVAWWGMATMDQAADRRGEERQLAPLHRDHRRTRRRADDGAEDVVCHLELPLSSIVVRRALRSRVPPGGR